MKHMVCSSHGFWAESKGLWRKELALHWFTAWHFTCCDTGPLRNKEIRNKTVQAARKEGERLSRLHIMRAVLQLSARQCCCWAAPRWPMPGWQHMGQNWDWRGWRGVGDQAAVLDLGPSAQILSPGILCQLLSEHGNLGCARSTAWQVTRRGAITLA